MMPQPMMQQPMMQQPMVQQPLPNRSPTQTPSFRQQPVNDPPVQTVIRGVSSDQQRPAPAPQRGLPPEPIRIPSPEQLGVAAPRPKDPGLDWVAIRKRLDELGAVGFQLEQLPSGGYRFICHLPTAAFGQTQGVEVQAPSEAEAVSQCLARAELWRRRN